MRTLARQLGPVLVFAVAAVLITCWRGRPDWGAGRAPDRGLVTDEGTAADDEYGPQRRYLAWSYPVRLRVGRALLAGDITLWEAAACFRQVEALSPPRLRVEAEE